ncbi:MAG: AAA family ATPase [Candidatus Omnitrophica bacterium]|nr:AAA family ATPase [Candidatus Omnitrophota bacterium]
MYEAFYGLKEKPFHVTADPAFLYPSRQHQEAMAHLTYGIRERLGFLMITGEVGTGKTTLAKALVERLEAPTRTALILNPSLSGSQMLRSILHDFGVEVKAATRYALLAALEQFLLAQAKTGGCGVLIIDEAQALNHSTLDQVRLLSNVETPKAKLLQIVLVGQPELEERLATPRLRALAQRIAVRYRINPLGLEEVADYIQHRLKIARAERPPEFTQEAILAVARASRGIPRKINFVCDAVLLAGFVRETRTIDAGVVAEALKEKLEPVA